MKCPGTRRGHAPLPPPHPAECVLVSEADAEGAKRFGALTRPLLSASPLPAPSSPRAPMDDPTLCAARSVLMEMVRHTPREPPQPEGRTAQAPAVRNDSRTRRELASCGMPTESGVGKKKGGARALPPCFASSSLMSEAVPQVVEPFAPTDACSPFVAWYDLLRRPTLAWGS